MNILNLLRSLWKLYARGNRLSSFRQLVDQLDLADSAGLAIDDISKFLGHAVRLNRTGFDYKVIQSIGKQFEEINKAALTRTENITDPELLIKIECMPSAEKSLLERVKKPLSDVAEILWLIDSNNIEKQHVIYAIELLQTVLSKDYNDHKWLAAISELNADIESTAAVKNLLDIFDNIIDVHHAANTDAMNVNRIMSQLTNIDRLASRVNDAVINNVKYQIKKIKTEALDKDHIRSNCYSQEGEDLILSRLFPNQSKGFYVDIGAHHPTRFSNTYLLYKRGWRGINIDPLPGSKEKFDRIRPRDLNLEVAVSSNVNPDGCMSYVQFEEPAYNYILPNENEIIEQENSKVIAIKNVPAKKLDDILEENCSQFDAIDLLNLDVESMEMDVLKSFSIDKYSPKVVVVEIRGLTIEEIQQSAIYHYLLRNHYRLQSVLYNSKIFTHVNE